MNLPETIRAVQAKSTCLYDRTQVEAALDHMATQINHDLCNENPILLCVMVGGLIPAGNLLLRLDFPLEVDYIHATRYGQKMKGGELEWRVGPRSDFSNRAILVVDDILDGGLTLAAVNEYCLNKGAKKVYNAVLLDKQVSRQPGGLAKADYTGLMVGDQFVYGFGMDYKEYLRNAPGIFVAPESID